MKAMTTMMKITTTVILTMINKPADTRKVQNTQDQHKEDDDKGQEKN